MSYRFHFPGIPHAITRREYGTCAFTQKVLKLSAMLVKAGHHVVHYGNEDSDLICSEHVTVTTRDDLERSYPGHDWQISGHPNFAMEDFAYQRFFENAIYHVGKRKQAGDFLLCPFGSGHRPLAEAHPDLVTCEPGIGYPSGRFARFAVYESYALMHAYQGQNGVAYCSNDHWYDAVIPNYFDPSDFEFSAEKDDYLLFLGRVGTAKGTPIALQVAEATGHRIIVAGAGLIDRDMVKTDKPFSDYIEMVGVVGPEQKKKLLAKAKATICATTFVEPFCGVQIESMLSGTPVISTDRGAFVECNLHGITGYRCRTFEQFVWAAKNIGKIDPYACREWASKNFCLDRVTEMYEEYFWTIAGVARGEDWYRPNPERSELNWLSKAYPGAMA